VQQQISTNTHTTIIGNNNDDNTMQHTPDALTGFFFDCLPDGGGVATMVRV
jgi:hypothetical protein